MTPGLPLLCFWVLFALSSVLSLPANTTFCNNNRLSYEDIKLDAVNCTVSSCGQSSNIGYTYFFPHLTIHCNGSLAIWTVSGELSLGVIDTNPTLLVWRESPDDPKEYKIHQRIGLTYCNGNRISPNSKQVYRCELQSGLPVQEGDVLGMEIPFYGSGTSRLYPYFDRSSNSSPEIYFRKGTSLLTFIKSGSSMVRLLPLLDVEVIQDEATTALRTTEKNGTVANSTRIIFDLWKMIAIAASVFTLFVALLLLMGIQCCVITRNRNRNKRKKSIRKGDEYSTEPYAVVDVREMDTSPSRLPLKIPQRRADRIPLNKNPSYAVTISTTVGGRNNNGGSVNASEESLLRGSSNPMPEAQALDQDGDDYSKIGISPDRAGHSYRNDCGLINMESQEDYVNLEDISRPDEVDSDIQLDSATDWNSQQNENGKKHIYY